MKEISHKSTGIPFTRIIQEQLEWSLSKHGFKLVPEWNQFRKPTKNGFQCIIYALKSYPDLSFLELHLGIRIDMVEQLVFPYLNLPTGFKKESMTLVTNFSNLVDCSVRTPIKEVDELKAHLVNQQSSIEETILPFLDSYSSLKALAGLFNANPTEPFKLHNNQIHRCFRGLALAKGSTPDQLESLCKIYQSVLDQWAAPPLVQDRFVRSLDDLRG